jgi:hypothetical protein
MPSDEVRGVLPLAIDEADHLLPDHHGQVHRRPLHLAGVADVDAPRLEHPGRGLARRLVVGEPDVLDVGRLRNQGHALHAAGDDAQVALLGVSAAG